MKRSINNDTLAGLKHVEAALNYFVDTGEKPVNYAYKPPPGVPQQSGQYTHHTVPVRDGRAILDQLSLDGEGFRLINHESKEAEARLQHRFAQINVWRPIRGPVEESPLALCDAQSMAQEDFVAAELRHRHRTGETYRITFNPAHRWFYFPHMQKNEVVLIKGYDSLEDGRARFTGHTGFEDPTSPPDTPARESIEARMLVFFAPEA